MNDRTGSFPSENGWTAGNMNLTPSYPPPPPYHSVPSEVHNFTNSMGPPQVPFPMNNFCHSGKRNPEPPKFNAAFCPPPYFNDVASFDMCPTIDNNLKQQYNHTPHPQSLHSTNQPGSHFAPTCVQNDVKGFPPMPMSQATYLGGFNTSSLPTEQSNAFHNQPEVVPYQNFQPLPNPSFVQRYDVPPASEAVSNFQQFPLMPNFALEPPQYGHPPPPAYPTLPYPPIQPQVKPVSEKEQLLTAFLDKMQATKKKTTKSVLTVVEFRSALKMGLFLTKMLLSCKQNLTGLLHSEEDKWNAEMHSMNELKKQLSSVCSVLSAPGNLSVMEKRLKTIRKKRASKSRVKQEVTYCRLQKAREREALHHEIDKWLDGIKEKNLKLKREAEMKKEADNILSEVRRKIHEVNRATEKLKVFEKLRATRQANAEQKGLLVSADHGIRFCERLTLLRDRLSSQLQDYEAEERALRVMLEAEQEGQLEEEALWRQNKSKALQHRKQQSLMQALFGHAGEPSPTDPLFLFHQHHNAGNCSIDALVQIRHHWDVHLAENGDTLPQQWVVPLPPSGATWEASLEIT